MLLGLGQSQLDCGLHDDLPSSRRHDHCNPISQEAIDPDAGQYEVEAVPESTVSGNPEKVTSICQNVANTSPTTSSVSMLG